VDDISELLASEGVLLESAKGPIPNVAQLVAGEPIAGSWWAHRASHEIFAAINQLADSADLARTRLVNHKIPLVHRRFWPALVRVAGRFDETALVVVIEHHTRTGAHRATTIPFCDWAPHDVLDAAGRLSEAAAIDMLPAILREQLSARDVDVGPRRARLVSMRIVIEGHDLPGAMFVSEGVLLTNVHVGVQMSNVPDQLVRGDATHARWEIDVSVVADRSDFRGPAVQGKRGERFVYLTWGDVGDDGSFTMFRRAKLMFADIDAVVLDQAVAGGVLVASISLTDERGCPRCARVRPPAISWRCG